MRRSAKAYSLLELLISLSIISILCTISLPSLMNFYQQKVEENAISQLLNTLAFAHHEALIRGKSIGVCQSKNRKNCSRDWQTGYKDGYIVFLDLYGDGSIRNDAQVLAVRQGLKLSGQLHYRAYPFYRKYLLFSPKKWLDNDNGTFWYCPHQSNESTKKTSPVFAIFFTKSGKAHVAYPDKLGQIKMANGKLLSCA